jgi:hypothetical protein
VSAQFDIGAEVAAANRAIGIAESFRVTRPGVYAMPADDYHADPCVEPSLSSSIGKIIISRSPLHAWAAHPRLNPDHEPEERTTFDLGSAAHALLLEGEDRMQVIDAPDYRTKVAQEARAAARQAGRHPVLSAQYRDVTRMVVIARAAIAGCDDLGGLTLADGESERVIVWQEDGIWLRARLDWKARDDRAVLDYKTSTDAEPGAFSRQISRMAYHFQAAFYRRGMKALTGKAPEYTLIAQEVETPYGVSFHGCAPSLMAIADDQVEMAITIWRKCIRSNVWPGYSQRIHWAEAESWQLAEHEERQLIGIPYDISRLWEKQG